MASNTTKLSPDGETANRTEIGSATSSRRRPRVRNLLPALGAGLVASLVAVVCMGLLLLVAGIPTPVNLFGDFLLKHIDVFTFIRFLQFFWPHFKTTPLGLTLVGMIGAGTVLGVVYVVLARVMVPVQTRRPGRREWMFMTGLAVVMTLVAVVLFWDELRQNQFGLPVEWARAATSVGLLLDFVAYSLTLGIVYRLLLPVERKAGETEVVRDRRQLLSRLGVGALGAGAAVGIVGELSAYLQKEAKYDGMWTPTHADITSPITPNDEHYVVTQNVVDPQPIPSLWRLEVTGLVERPGTYTYEVVQQLPSVSRAITLECISNGVGSRLMGTAIWQGVSLRTLLERHGGATSGAQYIAFHSVDGYTISLPLNEVLAVDAMAAWRMNGAELPQRHGYPLRVLIPGRYGEENPKWVTQIELTDHFVKGLYAAQGWYNGPLHTTSRIDRPHGKVVRGQEIEVGGIAFAGNRGIQKVEISTDNGKTWNSAQLQPPLSQDAWILWTWQWKPLQSGTYTLVSRATDGTGEVQTSTPRGTVPNGGTGYHRMQVEVI